jgi:hypothetical protein
MHEPIIYALCSFFFRAQDDGQKEMIRSHEMLRFSPTLSMLFDISGEMIQVCQFTTNTLPIYIYITDNLTTAEQCERPHALSRPRQLSPLRQHSRVCSQSYPSPIAQSPESPLHARHVASSPSTCRKTRSPTRRTFPRSETLLKHSNKR